jgi:hypothetical protein
MSEYVYRALEPDDAERFRELRRSVVAVSPVGMGATLGEELQRPEAFFRGQLGAVFV